MKSLCSCAGFQRCAWEELELVVSRLAHGADAPAEAYEHDAVRLAELASRLAQVARSAAVREIAIREGSNAAAARLLGISGVRVSQIIRGER